jgi:hypothetical protein
MTMTRTLRRAPVCLDVSTKLRIAGWPDDLTKAHSEEDVADSKHRRRRERFECFAGKSTLSPSLERIIWLAG